MDAIKKAMLLAKPIPRTPSWSAIPRPIPLLEPVTRQTFPDSDIFEFGKQIQFRMTSYKIWALATGYLKRNV